MSGQFYLNPTCFFFRRDGKAIIQMGLGFEKELADEKHASFIRHLEKRDGAAISFEELCEEFTASEIRELFERRVLIDRRIDVKDRLSRSQCFFSYKGIDITRLKDKKALILGAGALGSHMLWLFGTTNIGQVSILDFDVVEPSNLNRQLMYDETDIGRRKLEAIGEKFRRQNSKIRFIAHDRKILSEADLEEIITLDNPDIVVSAIDTPESVHDWINSVCVRHEIPYVTGGFVEDKAILGPTYVPHRTDCYNCVQRPDIANGSIRSGVGATFSAIAEYVAGKLFTEVVKILTGKLNQVAYGGKTALYDWYTNTETPVEFPLKEKCEVCCREHPKPPEKKSPGYLTIAYYLISFMIPIINLLIGGSVPFVCASLLASNLIPAFFVKKPYETAFYGSLLYTLNTIQLTVTTNLAGMNLAGSVATQVYTFVLIILTMVSLGNIFYLGIVYLLRALTEALRNPGRKKVPQYE